MKVFTPLTENADKQTIADALANLPAPGVLKIAKFLDVETKGNKFSRMQDIFDKNTLPRIVNVYNTFVAAKNGKTKLLVEALNVGKDVVNGLLPLINLLIENDGKINIDDVLNFVTEKVNVPVLEPANGLNEYQALSKQAKDLGFKGRGKKEDLINFIEAQNA